MPYIAIIPNYWARHNDKNLALDRAYAEAGLHGARERMKVPYRLYEVEDPEAYCNEVDGSICHRRGTKVKLLDSYDPPTKKKH